MISGPMPSPYATVIGVFFSMLSPFGRLRRASYERPEHGGRKVALTKRLEA